MPRYSYKYKFITSQQDKYGEYYVYRFEKPKPKDEIITVIVYKMKGTRIHPITSFKIQKNDYYSFKRMQEIIEERKFM